MSSRAATPAKMVFKVDTETEMKQRKRGGRAGKKVIGVQWGAFWDSLLKNQNQTDMKKLLPTKEFWRDALWFAGVFLLLYLVYIIVVYWPNIVEGFNRGWNGQ